MNDLLLHLPIIWIVSTFTPARYMAMAAPDLIESSFAYRTAVENRYFNSSSAASAHALIL
jgi:hypothetical protein